MRFKKTILLSILCDKVTYGVDINTGDHIMKVDIRKLFGKVARILTAAAMGAGFGMVAAIATKHQTGLAGDMIKDAAIGAVTGAVAGANLAAIVLKEDNSVGRHALNYGFGCFAGFILSHSLGNDPLLVIPFSAVMGTITGQLKGLFPKLDGPR